MKCSYCGAEISERERFCPFCGTRQTPALKAEPAPLPEADPLAEMGLPDDPMDMPIGGGEEFAWQPYQSEQPPEAPKETPLSPAPSAERPRIQLPTRRSLTKMVFLGIITLGIYPLVIWSRIVTELNLAASRYDGRRTMPFFAMLLLIPITFGIFPLVWFHRFSRRVGQELQRRGIGYRFGPKDYWLWDILGCLILVGPFVYVQKLMKSMNYINAHFNIHG